MSDWIARSDIKVVFDDASTKGDRGIAMRAWAADPTLYPEGHEDNEKGWERLIRAVLKNKHGTPLEAGYFSVYVEAPVVGWWEWTRHRFMAMNTEDQSFALESGRYRVLKGHFYRPPPNRPCREPADFKPMRPTLVQDAACWDLAGSELTTVYDECWYSYEKMVAAGVAREVARLALPFGIYYAGYVSANPRTWLQFFSLRKRDERAVVATYPQWEIEQADEQCEKLFAERWPITYRLFNELGRVAV